MMAAPVSRPKADPVRALELIAQARELLDLWDDPRGALLDQMSEVWTRTGTARDRDPRWLVAANLIGHDDVASAEDPLRYSTMRLLVEIARDVEDMDSMRREHSTRKDVQRTARELRANAGRLAEIVHAITAVHSLGSAES